MFSPLSLPSRRLPLYDLYSQLELDEYCPSNDLVYEDAKLHMKKYHHNLPKEIDDLLDDIRQHNSEVEQLIFFINEIINKKYYAIIPNRLFQLTFYEDNVRNISLTVWGNVIRDIQNSANIQKMKEDIDISIDRLTIISKGSNNNELAILNQDVGKGTYTNDSGIIMDIFINNALKNELILQKLVYTLNNRLKIEYRIMNISHHFHTLSNAIEMNYYEEKAKCCPTILKAVRNYFF